MIKYLKFLKVKIYLGVLIVLGCAMLGSVLGARKESKEPLNGVTEEDVLISEQENNNAPELIGILPLAAEQNKWYNFKYAGVFGIAGVFIYCALMAFYLPLYHLHFFEMIRKWFGLEGKVE